MKKKLLVGLIVMAALWGTGVATASWTAPDNVQVVVDFGISSVSLSSADLKALEWDVADGDDWIENAVDEKVRRAKDRMVMATLQDPDGMLLSYKQEVASMLSGVVVTCPDDIPANVKDYIVMHSNLPNARERTAALLQQQADLFVEPVGPTPTPEPTQMPEI